MAALDPNDEELKAILLAAADASDDEESSPPAKNRKKIVAQEDQEEESQFKVDGDVSDSELVKAMQGADSEKSDEESDREESKVAPKKREVKKASKKEPKQPDVKDKKKSKKEGKEPVVAMGGAKGPEKQGAKAQPEKKMMNEKEAYEAVMKYMEQQNRPYSVQNIMDNMHGRIPRKICETVLDRLTKEEHLVCKEFGKAKVYLAN